jgi:hypothetical protein
MKTKTPQEVIAIQAAWYKRLDEIQERWDVCMANEGLVLGMEIAMVAFILETGLTPRTAETFIEKRISEFENTAQERSTRKLPKGRRLRRRPIA